MTHAHVVVARSIRNVAVNRTRSFVKIIIPKTKVLAVVSKLTPFCNESNTSLAILGKYTSQYAIYKESHYKDYPAI